MNEHPVNDSDTQPVVGTGDPKRSPLSTRMLLLSVGSVLVICLGVGLVIFWPTKSAHHGPVPQATALATVAPAKVSITEEGFVPSTVSVKVGQAIVWTNTTTNSHVVASDPYPTDNMLSGLNSKQVMALHDSYSYVFTKAGRYTYHDNLNPYSFHGTVIVK